VLPIAEPVVEVEKTLAGVFGGRTPDATEENIQSRLRGLLLMALSNKFGPLVLTTATSRNSRSAIARSTATCAVRSP